MHRKIFNIENTSAVRQASIIKMLNNIFFLRIGHIIYIYGLLFNPNILTLTGIVGKIKNYTGRGSVG